MSLDLKSVIHAFKTEALVLQGRLNRPGSLEVVNATKRRLEVVQNTIKKIEEELKDAV